MKNKQAEDLLILKESYYNTLDNITPLNLIKSATLELITDRKLKSNLLFAAIGFGVNFLSKKLLNYSAVKQLIAKIL